jgi:exonuclease SbcD
MRILHFADLHLGVESYGRPDPATGLSTRLLDFLSTLDEVVETALSQPVDLVLFCGDAYKSRDPSQTHQRELARRLACLSEAGVPVFLLVGNHDLPHAIGRATAVEIFHTLQIPHIYVGDRLGTHRIPTRDGPIQVVALPWVRRSAFLAREETRGMTMEEVNRAIEERLTRLLKTEAERLDPGIPAVLAGHIHIMGAQTGTEHTMTLGRDYTLMLSAVADPAFDYVALGHIHKQQTLNQNPPVVYPGSLQRVDFSEEEDEKGFYLVELDPSRPRGERVVEWEFRRVGARPFLSIDVDIPPGDENPTERVIKAIARRQVAGAVVRLRIRIPVELVNRLQDEALTEALREAHFVASIQKDVVGQQRRHIGRVAEGLSPGEALRLYLKERCGLPEGRVRKLLEYAQSLIEEEARS